MELGRVEAVRAVGPMKVKRSSNSVAPAFGVDGPGRMEEDSYNEGAKQQERGLEEEGLEQEDLGQEDPETEVDGSNVGAAIPGKVDVLA